jgi:hypothetical protein
MDSFKIEDFGDDVYNICFTGKFDIYQSFALNKDELHSLAEIRNHLDEKNYTYESDDGVVSYKQGVLTLYFDINDENDRLNTNQVYIKNVREFIDKLI